MKNEGARPRGVRIDDKVDEERRREATRGRRHEATRHEATRGGRHEATRVVGTKPQGDVMKSLSLGAP